MPRGGRTSGTRKKSEYVGYGGPARGAGNGNKLTEQGKVKGRAKFAIMTFDERMTAHLKSEACALEMRSVWRDIALDEGLSAIARVSAAERLLERIEGKIVEKRDDRENVTINLSPDDAKL